MSGPGFNNRESNHHVIRQKCLGSIGSTSMTLRDFDLNREEISSSTSDFLHHQRIEQLSVELCERIYSASISSRTKIINPLVIEAFESESLVETNESFSLLEIIGISCETLEVDYVNRLIKRLEFLATSSGAVDDLPMQIGSLKYFINFIRAHSPKYPDIVLTPDGEVRAEWRTDRKHHFVSEFLPNGFVRYLAFVVSQKDDKQIERNTGLISFEKLCHVIQMTGADEWCF